MIDDVMITVTVSPKFQVVIPQEIRRVLGLVPGQKLRVVAVGDQIRFVPIKPMKAMRGFVRGIDTAVKRERDRL
jgi:AbrB family looped-hinge helix DNA binding protein